MQVEQIYTGCLAQGAYYITANGEAAIIDPLREITPYLERLKKDNVVLKYIFETHFHADFVSGHLDLSKATGVPVVYGPNANPDFEALIGSDNQEFVLGNCKIKLLHTPGHTMESSSYLLIDENGEKNALFSGDTLFIGDVGRPDLAQKAASMTQDELAGMLFNSLREKIMTLPDEVTVYPAHGAGSACGKNMSKETVSTIGAQKATNYALRANMTQAEFIKEVTDGLLPPPAYFAGNVMMNKKGYESFETVKKNGLKPLSLSEFESLIENENNIILDTRSANDFHQGFIPNAINIGIKGDFAPWVGAVLKDVNQSIILITDEGMQEEVITRLARVGFDQQLGYLEGGFNTWKNAGKTVETIHRISADAFASQVDLDKDVVIDVRKETEYAAQHVNNAYSMPLSIINDWTNTLKDKQEHFYIHCQGGYRSMIAASILQARGITNFTEVNGGFGAISKTGIPTSDFICSSKTIK